jgi:drug/metabolite transporter (DMT)-like permease
VTWYLFAALAGLASAVNVAASKLLVAGRLHPALVGGAVHLSGGLLLIPAIIIGAPNWRLSLGVLAGVALMGVVYTVANTLYFSALRQSQLSEIDLLLRTSSLWTFVGGVAFLAEPAGAGVLLGAALIVASVLLLSGQRRPLRFDRAQLMALGAAFAFGAGNLIDKEVSAAFDPLGYTAINLLLTGVGMLALVPGRWGELRPAALWGARAWTVAITFALTQWLLILAFAAGGSAGQVILVAQLRLIALTTVGVVLLGERDRLGRKLLAAALMLGGLVSLYALRPAG